jgi:transposase InsO family protein
MRSRSEVLSIYQRFAAMVLTQFSTPIRVFRADSTGEYISKQLRGVLAEQGTLAQFSCPGAHAQNGVAERKHRYLLKTTRAMMIAPELLKFSLTFCLLPPYRVAFLSSVSLVVLLTTRRFVCLVAFAIFSLPLANTPN